MDYENILASIEAATEQLSITDNQSIVIKVQQVPASDRKTALVVGIILGTVVAVAFVAIKRGSTRKLISNADIGHADSTLAISEFPKKLQKERFEQTKLVLSSLNAMSESNCPILLVALSNGQLVSRFLDIFVSESGQLGIESNIRNIRNKTEALHAIENYGTSSSPEIMSVHGPLDASPDAFIVSQITCGTILLISSGINRSSDVLQAVSTLRDIGSPVFKLIILDVK
jgi:hypothetical protein